LTTLKAHRLKYHILETTLSELVHELIPDFYEDFKQRYDISLTMFRKLTFYNSNLYKIPVLDPVSKFLEDILEEVLEVECQEAVHVILLIPFYHQSKYLSKK
jgi:hypothetical protein